MKGSPNLDNPEKDWQKEKRKLLNKIAALDHKIITIQNENSKLQQQIESNNDVFTKKEAKMRSDLKFIIDKKESEYKKQISDISDNNFLIPNEIIQKHKFLFELIKYAMGSEPSIDFVNFCRLIHEINQRSYSILQDFLPVIPERSIFTINSPEKNQIREHLSNSEKVPEILSNYFKDSSDDKKTHLVLGGDAASVKLIPESGLSAVYTYMALPFDKKKKSIPLHLCPTNNGTSNKKIVEKCDEIIYLIEKDKKFVVDFVATDGDKAFDKRHINFFKSIESLLFNKKLTYKEKVLKLKDKTHIPINDPFHILKNGRSHLLNHLLMVDPETYKIINMHLFQENTQITNAINDRTSISAMKDSYAMQLFSWQTFENLIFRKQYDAALYVLPFTYLNQAINSPNLNRDERLTLLEYAIKNFIFHLNNVRKSQTTDFFTPSFTENSIGTLFGEVIFIQRCINTCFALSIAMFKGYDIPFSRLGTHNIENYFGKIRLLSHFNFTFDNFLRSAVSANLVNQLCYALNYKLKIPKRISESGAFVPNQVLMSEKNGEFHFDLISDTIFELLREKNSEPINLEKYVKEYSSFLSLNPNSSKLNYQSIYSGVLPHVRLTSNSYATRINKISNSDDKSNSPFGFYFKEKSNQKKDLSIFQWFQKLLNTFKEIRRLDGKLHYSEVINLSEYEIDKESNNKMINWFVQMQENILQNENKSNKDQILDKKEEKKYREKIIFDIKHLIQKIIENRSVKFKKNQNQYVNDNLTSDLNEILMIIINNYNIDGSIKEIIEHYNSGDEELDDITENIIDMSNINEESDN